MAVRVLCYCKRLWEPILPLAALRRGGSSNISGSARGVATNFDVCPFPPQLGVNGCALGLVGCGSNVPILQTPPQCPLGGDYVDCSSIIKKRRMKMNKHKYKKWRKKTRALRRKLGR